MNEEDERAVRIVVAGALIGAVLFGAFVLAFA